MSERSSTTRRTALPGAVLRGVALAVAVAIVAGCGSIDAPATVEAPPTTSTSRAGGAPAAADAPDPRSLTGPATAATVAEVSPVANDPTPTLPVTLTDAEGRAVTVTDTSRILALDIYGTLAETVIGLGQGDRLVGRSASNAQPALADLPLVTRGGHELNAESILALRPTVLLTDTTLGPREVQEQVASSGVAVVFLDPHRDLDRVGPQIEAVGHALGLDAEGRALADRATQEITDAQAAIAAVTPADPLRMAFLYVRGRGNIFFLMGQGSGADSLITAIGGRDVASESGVRGTRPANAEAVAAAAPEVLLTMTDGLESTGGVEGLLTRPGVGDTPAGSRRRVVDMDDAQLLSFGPTTGAVLRSLATAVYGIDVTA